MRCRRSRRGGLSPKSQGGRWMGHLDTTGLGFRLLRVSIRSGGLMFGGFELIVDTTVTRPRRVERQEQGLIAYADAAGSAPSPGGAGPTGPASRSLVARALRRSHDFGGGGPALSSTRCGAAPRIGPWVLVVRGRVRTIERPRPGGMTAESRRGMTAALGSVLQH